MKTKWKSLLSWVKPYRPDRIIVGLSERKRKTPVTALLRLKSRGVKIQDVCEVYEAVTGKGSDRILRFEPTTLFSPGFQLSRTMVVYTRVCSLVLSFLRAYPGLAAIGGLISLAIRLDSAGPVIFRQQRVGKGGKDFHYVQFGPCGTVPTRTIAIVQRRQWIAVAHV